MDNSIVLKKLKDRGIAKATIYFSGGNDEGGADSTEFLDKNGKKLDIDLERQTWQNRDKEKGADEELAEALEEPIHAKYYSFAGDWYVDGELVWDVKDGTVKMSGSESYTEYTGFEDDI